MRPNRYTATSCSQASNGQQSRAWTFLDHSAGSRTPAAGSRTSVHLGLTAYVDGRRHHVMSTLPATTRSAVQGSRAQYQSNRQPTRGIMTRLSLPVRQLAIGDIVHCHGMRCLVIEPPQLSTSHPSDNGGCWFTSAVVLNADEVSASGQVPYSFMRKDELGRRRWSLQANDLAPYSVERGTDTKTPRATDSDRAAYAERVQDAAIDRVIAKLDARKTQQACPDCGETDMKRWTGYGCQHLSMGDASWTESSASTGDLHPHLAAILAKCPSYYSAVCDEYVALIARGASEHTAMRDCFYVECFAAMPHTLEVASFIESLADMPTRGERMLVRQLAKIPSV